MRPAARAAAPGHTTLDSLSTPMALAVGVALLAALASCAPGGIAHLGALADALACAWPAALWVASASGTGRWLARRCRVTALHPWPAAAATGACAMAAFDAAAGWAGLLSGPRAFLWAAALLAPGIAALAWELIRDRSDAARPDDAHDPSHGRRARAPWWFGPGLGLALPAFVVAAASEPGALWSTEFGAYDALSYHLTLPQEWHAGEGIATLAHCAYSGMPSWMEAAYLHIRAIGDGRTVGGSSWFISAQMLHAGLAVVAAMCVGTSARRALPASGDGSRAAACAIATLLLLGLPWLAVTGTLAYSESLMLCAFAAAMCVLMDAAATRSLARAELLSLAGLAVAAFGAKPSAALLVGLPVIAAAIPLWRGRTLTARIAEAIACVALAAALLAPWWIRNTLSTGNPLFPFAEQLLGHGAWTDEQSARFAQAHAASGMNAWTGLWKQWVAFGWGDPPAKGAAWRPLWSLMPIMVIGALAWSIRESARARALRTPQALCALVIAVQLAAWLALTHHQSRFLLPVAVPGSLLIASLIIRMPRLQHATLLGATLLAWSAQPALAFLRDGPDPRAAALWIGAAHDLAGASPPANLVQAINGLNPESARVASAGLSATAWVRPDVALDWCSVWDRGAVAQALAATRGDGRAAAQLLSLEGWTHVAIDRVMLDVWTRAGWIDPVLTPEAIDGLRSGHRVIWAGPQGVLLALDEGGAG